MSDTTTSIAYYDANAEKYCAKTIGIDMSAARHAFAKRLKPGAKILDVGSGSGRDAVAFLDAGFDVSLLDPSAGLAACAEAHLRENLYFDRFVRVLRAEELLDVDTFDAVWSCASFVHMTLKEAERSMLALMRALKPDGYFFLSVQEGDSVDHLYDGRRMVRYGEDTLRRLFRPYAGIVAVDRNEDKHPEKRDIGWISVTARKYTR